MSNSVVSNNFTLRNIVFNILRTAVFVDYWVVRFLYAFWSQKTVYGFQLGSTESTPFVITHHMDSTLILDFSL